jgi:hypothetical protein
MKISRLALGLLFFIVSGCSSVHQSPRESPIDFDPDYLNQQINLLVVKGFGPLKTDGPLAILLEYNTTNKIIFPSNYNLRIFIQQDGEWLEILERPVIWSEDQVILSPNDPSSYGHIVTFWPQLSDPNKTYNMRLYVFGDMTTPEGIKRVAAFVDFVVVP